MTGLSDPPSQRRQLLAPLQPQTPVREREVISRLVPRVRMRTIHASEPVSMRIIITVFLADVVKIFGDAKLLVDGGVLQPKLVLAPALH